MEIVASFLRVGKLSVRLLRSGVGSRGILFIHGNSCSADDWMAQLNSAKLNSQYQLASVDLPGHGCSDRSADYSLATMARVISDIIWQLEWSEYAVVGLSLGTAYLAEAAPLLQGLRAMIMISPNVTNNEHLPSSYLKMTPGIEAAFSLQVADETLREFAESLALGPDDPVVADYIRQYREADGTVRVAVAQAAQQGSWTDEFSNIRNAKVPCLFVFGEKDKNLNSNYLDDTLTTRGFKKVMVPASAHFVNKDQPELTNDLIFDFLAESFK